jgi:hypothetical protein
MAYWGGDGEFSMLGRRSETILHTERKSVEDPISLTDAFTPKLCQQFGDNQLSVLLPLDFVPIRHVQNKPALKA